MSYTYTFKYNIGDTITTVLGDVGVIRTATVGRGNYIGYYVMFKEGRSNYVEEEDIETVKSRLD